MKAWKVTISGSYRGAQHEIFDFQDLEGVIPFCEEDIAIQAIRKRYASMWIIKSEKYKERLVSVREVHIDEMEEVDADFSYIGKNIKEMSFEELQDLATAKNLTRVQLYKKVSLRENRTMAYVEYSNKIMKQDLDHRKEGFNFFKLPPIFVDGNVQRDMSRRLTNDEIIAQEQESKSTPKTTLTLDDLKKIANSAGIKYHPAIGHEALYAKIYQSAA